VAAVATATDGASGADLRELVRRAVLVHGDTVDDAALRDLVRDGAWHAHGDGLYL
jgi:cell division protease FtsH